MNIPVAKPTSAFAATVVGARLAPFAIERRPVGPRDVLIEIDYCGVCHSDLHMVNNDWGMSAFLWCRAMRSSAALSPWARR